MESKIRYNEIDIYRGLAIILIILGHSFCEFPVNIKDEFLNLQSFVASFNLSMFFWISGVLFSVKGTWGLFFEKKLKRLMLPWVVFVLLSILLRSVAGAFTHSHLESIPQELWLAITTAKYYWFIYALFLMMLLTRLIKNKMVLAILGGALLILSILDLKPSWNALLIKRMLYFYPWFLLGFLIKNFYSKLSEYVREHINVLMTLATIIFSSITILWFVGVEIMVPYLIPICICTCLWVWSAWLTSLIKNERIFTWFGIYSLQYYLNHCLIMLGCFYVGAKVFPISSLLALLTVFLFGIAISTIMLFVEKRFKLLRFLCGFN